MSDGRDAPNCPLAVPSGWYCVGFSREIARKTVMPRVLAGDELVLFRTEAGALAAVDAHCPHLGASFAHGGTVRGEQLCCPFHGFCFTTEGACASTPYDGKPPPRARLRTRFVRELHGLVMVWYDAAGEGPRWEVPDVALDGWTEWHHHLFELRTHPQEVAENAVDYGHLSTVHEYDEVDVLTPATLDGPELRSHFSFVRSGGLLGRGRIRAEAHVHQWGLGYARVEVELASLGLRLRHLVLSMPLDRNRLHLRIAVSVQHPDTPRRLNLLAAWLPRSWLAQRIAGRALRQYVEDVGQDVPIWENKRWLQTPAIAGGDGPIGRYRTWARQFYPDRCTTTATGME